ncbi:unnamed protein product [Somion occarium]|uniref:Uncharacterized protein n=2 Tax=Somion occarium TaxID=3059160 RepID=A0ABP1E8J9_9APHY
MSILNDWNTSSTLRFYAAIQSENFVSKDMRPRHTAAPLDVVCGYTCTNTSGALLSIRDTPVSEKVVRCSTIVEYIRQHHASWYQFARQRKYNVDKEEIVIVHGWVKTRSWTAAAFRGEGASLELKISTKQIPHVNLALDVMSSRTISQTPEHRSGRTVGYSEGEMADASEPLPDQCVFLRYHKIKYRLGIFPGMKIAGNAEPRDHFDMHDGPDNGVGEVVSSYDVEIVPGQTKSRTLIDDVLEYLLEHSDADIAVSNDEDVQWLREVYNFGDGARGILQEICPLLEITTSGAAVLTRKPKTITARDDSNISFVDHSSQSVQAQLDSLEERLEAESCPPLDPAFVTAFSAEYNSRTQANTSTDAERTVNIVSSELATPAEDDTDAFSGLFSNTDPSLTSSTTGTMFETPVDYSLLKPWHMGSYSDYAVAPYSPPDSVIGNALGPALPLSLQIPATASQSPAPFLSPISARLPSQLRAQLPSPILARSVLEIARQFPHADLLIPQAVYRPNTQSDRRRYVEEVQLEDAIMFYVSDPDQCGISCRDALDSKFIRLQNRDDQMFTNRGPSVAIRLMWPGYAPWSRQIPTRDFRNPPGPITRAKLAKNVAKTIQRFIDDMADRPMEDEADVRWRVGPGHITIDRLDLVGLQHVSAGSWQAHVRLRM